MLIKVYQMFFFLEDFIKQEINSVIIPKNAFIK